MCFFVTHSICSSQFCLFSVHQGVYCSKEFQILFFLFFQDLKNALDDFSDIENALTSVIRGQGVWRDLLQQISSSLEGVGGQGLAMQPLTIGRIAGINILPNASIWQKFQLGVSKEALYGEKDEALISSLLQSMAKQAFSVISQKDGGTQFKLIVELEDGGEALFKPQRFNRSQETLPDHFYFTDFERHNAEVAAFHLDRLLGFRRAVPVTGRKINITTDIYELAEADLLKTFFISPAGNLCFHGVYSTDCVNYMNPTYCS